MVRKKSVGISEKKDKILKKPDFALKFPFRTYLTAKNTNNGEKKTISSKTDTENGAVNLLRRPLTKLQKVLLIFSAAFCDLIAISIKSNEEKNMKSKMRRIFFNSNKFSVCVFMYYFRTGIFYQSIFSYFLAEGPTRIK